MTEAGKHLTAATERHRRALEHMLDRIYADRDIIALGYMLDAHRIETLDPHTTGIITDLNGQRVEDIPFNFYSEDPSEWEELADRTLKAEGWRRLTDWTNNTAFIARPARSR